VGFWGGGVGGWGGGGGGGGGELLLPITVASFSSLTQGEGARGRLKTREKDVPNDVYARLRERLIEIAGKGLSCQGRGGSYSLTYSSSGKGEKALGI